MKTALQKTILTDTRKFTLEKDNFFM